MTRHHEQSLRNRIKTLDSYIEVLQAKLRSQGQSVPPINPAGAHWEGNGASGSGQQSKGTESADTGSPLEDPEDISSQSMSPVASGTEGETLVDETDSEMDKLCIPTENLFLGKDGLQHFGVTSVFRLGPLKPPQSFRQAAKRLERGPNEKWHVLVHPLASSWVSVPSPCSDGSEARRRSSLVPKSPTTPTSLDFSQQQHIPHCTCWESCWSRYLPSYEEVPLTREDHDLLLDLFFKFFTPWCMRTIPQWFLRDMYSILHPANTNTSQIQTQISTSSSRSAHYSPFLHNAVLAVASAFSPSPVISSLSSRTRFATKAKSYIESECERPSLSAVQGLAMLASFYSGLGQQTLGFMYFGMSTRISQALGLGSDCSQWVKAGYITPEDRFDRNWCFHMGCQQDSCWSLYVGRDFGIPARPVDPKQFDHPIGHSLNMLEFEWKVASSDGHNVDSGDGDGDIKAPSWDVIVPRQPSHMCTAFLANADLMWVSRRIMDVMNRLGKSEATGQAHVNLLVAEIDIQLTMWKEKLPAELKWNSSHENQALPHKIMLHLAYWWLVILLHRPFYRRQRVAGIDLPFSVNRCNVAAREIMTLVRLYKKLYTLRYTPITFIQFVFAAGTVYLLTAVQANLGARPAPITRETALENFRATIEALKEVGRTWENARKIAEILSGLWTEQRRLSEGKASAASAQKGSENQLKETPLLQQPATATGSSVRLLTSTELPPTGLQGQDLRGIQIGETSQSAGASMTGIFDTTFDFSLPLPPISGSSIRTIVPSADSTSLQHSSMSRTVSSEPKTDADITMEDVFVMCGMGLGMVDGNALSLQPYALAPHHVMGMAGGGASHDAEAYEHMDIGNSFDAFEAFNPMENFTSFYDGFSPPSFGVFPGAPGSSNSGMGVVGTSGVGVPTTLQGESEEAGLFDFSS